MANLSARPSYSESFASEISALGVSKDLLFFSFWQKNEIHALLLDNFTKKLVKVAAYNSTIKSLLFD